MIPGDTQSVKSIYIFIDENIILMSHLNLFEYLKRHSELSKSLIMNQCCLSSPLKAMAYQLFGSKPYLNLSVIPQG